MPDGKFNDFVRVSRKEWKYVFEGKDIVSARIADVGTGEQSVITWLQTVVEGRDLLERPAGEFEHIPSFEWVKKESRRSYKIVNFGEPKSMVYERSRD